MLTALSGLGLKVGVATRVGNDIFGDYLLAEWQQLGVDVSAVTRDAQAVTGFAFLLDHDGERTPFYAAGANLNFGLSDIPELFRRGSRCLLLYFAARCRLWTGGRWRSCFGSARRTGPP